MTSAQRAHTQPHAFSTCRETKNARIPSGTARTPNQSGGTHVPLTIGTSKTAKKGMARNQPTMDTATTSSVNEMVPNTSLANR